MARTKVLGVIANNSDTACGFLAYSHDIFLTATLLLAAVAV